MGRMAEEKTQEPRIIVDEDWKSRVEAEKREAEWQAQTTPEGGARASASAGTVHEGPMPPATLSFLVTTLATQAMVSLGQVPNPFSGKTEVRLPEARHFIDTLAMLDEKTANNRTPEESTLLESFLHQLRMSYLEAQSEPVK
jgi:Domain of unknown function (DUF1844)